MNCMSDEHQRELDTLRSILESKYKPLAFASDPELVSATFRMAVEVKHIKGENALLNVEIFSLQNSNAASPLLFYVHGICESAETKTVQNLAKWARDIGVRIAVIELEGHGLSSGMPSICEDFDRLVQQVLYVTSAVTAKLLAERPNTPYSICGSSMGGTLAIYAAEYLSRHLQAKKESTEAKKDIPTSEIDYESYLASLDFSKGSFASVVSVAPALGVKPEALPPSWMVSALSTASYIFPAAQPPFTPYEDASQYNCPEDTPRNFHGNWPLVTSKMLLDLTSKRVPKDVADGKLTLTHVPRVMILVGAKDHVIPVDSVEKVYEQIQAPSKEYKVLKKAGHDVLMHPVDSPDAMEMVFSTLL